MITNFVSLSFMTQKQERLTTYQKNAKIFSTFAYMNDFLIVSSILLILPELVHLIPNYLMGTEEIIKFNPQVIIQVWH